jgi:hypothetical protein
VSTGLIATLYVIGAALELIGIGLVGWDVYEARRNIQNYGQREWLEKLQEERGSMGLTQISAMAAAGSIWRRGLGVGVFALGVIVQMIGNLGSL